MRIVGIGGGTGLPVLLRGLKALSESHQEVGDPQGIFPAAVVCVTDNGGSSGALRRAFGVPGVGDLRNCLVALSSGDPKLADLFQYHLHGSDRGLAGHCLGNLIVTALHARAGNLRRAISLAGEMLQLKGQVLPCTDTSPTLCAELENGTVARGECEIVERRQPIRRVWLEPELPPAASGVLEALAEADAIVLGPGSLYTSILPNLLTEGVAAAIRSSPALKIFVCNLMTEPGETDHLSAADHIQVLEEYIGPRKIAACLLNSQPIGWLLASCHLADGSTPVKRDVMAIAERGIVPLSADLLAEGEPRVRHDPIKLARLVVRLTRGALRARDMAACEITFED
jgi:uncharacterized cofD-like protein